MSRLDRCFNKLKQTGTKALAIYIVSGDPEPGVTLKAMHQLVDSGANIIELGVPFSDPMAEGPVIQKGHERALAHKMSLKQTLDVVAQFRRTDADTPVILMGYANPIERMGYETFATLASEAGVDGALTVDLPPEEAELANATFKKYALDTIYLLAPTSSPERIAKVSRLASGFIYYVSLKGVTGAGHLDASSVAECTETIRRASSVPVMIGFGIKDASSTRAVAAYGDGVVVGSALVQIMGQTTSQAQMLVELGEKVSEIREALDQSRA